MKVKLMTALLNVQTTILAKSSRGMADIKAWLEEQKQNILVIFIPLFIIFVILCGFSIAASKRGLEENKPWLKNIVIGGLLVSFAAIIVTILFG